MPQVNIKQRKCISRRAVTFTKRKPVMAVVVKKGFWWMGLLKFTCRQCPCRFQWSLGKWVSDTGQNLRWKQTGCIGCSSLSLGSSAGTPVLWCYGFFTEQESNLILGCCGFARQMLPQFESANHVLSALDNKVGIGWLPVVAPYYTPGQARSCSKNWKVLIERILNIFWFYNWCIWTICAAYKGTLWQ